VSHDDFHTLSHLAHERVYDSAESARLARTWTRQDTVDGWRHARMYRTLDPLLTARPGARWVTVGDGRYGTDAHYLQAHGADALATDISDTMLQRAKEEGFIRDYRNENAEHLSFADGVFDYALCKESYHHFPRPMLALYELLRVARRGVVLIEPDETPILASPRHLVKMMVKSALIRLGLGQRFGDRATSIIDTGVNWYEEVGNFGYAISRREMERVALGLDLPHVAFLGLNDAYEPGVEDEPATEDSALFRRIRGDIAAQDRQSQRGLSRTRPKLLVAMIFKETLDPALRAALSTAGYEVRDLPRNPYLRAPRSSS
jgi:ubiquinone/menaquinone biosynthesis C-methylase UbiE